jgi:hypothetical protein
MRVPNYKQKNQTLQVPKMPSVNMPTAPQQAFDEGGQALESGGEALGQFADVIQKHLDKRQQIANKQQAENAFYDYSNAVSQRLMSPEIEILKDDEGNEQRRPVGFLRRELSDAADISGEYQEFNAQVFDEYLMKVEDPQMRDALFNKMRQFADSKYNEVVKHELSEERKNNKAIFKRSIAKQVEQFTLAQDEDSIQADMSNIAQTQKSFDETLGTDDEVTQGNIEEVVADGVEQAVLSSLHADVDGEVAMDLLDAAKNHPQENLRISQKTYNDLKTKVSKTSKAMKSTQKNLKESLAYKNLVDIIDGIRDGDVTMMNLSSIRQISKEGLPSGAMEALTQFLSAPKEGGYTESVYTDRRREEAFRTHVKQVLTSRSDKELGDALVNIFGSQDFFETKKDRKKAMILFRLAKEVGQDAGRMAEDQLDALIQWQDQAGIIGPEGVEDYVNGLLKGIQPQEAAEQAKAAAVQRYEASAQKFQQVNDAMLNALYTVDQPRKKQMQALQAVGRAIYRHLLSSGLPESEASGIAQNVIGPVTQAALKREEEGSGKKTAKTQEKPDKDDEDQDGGAKQPTTSPEPDVPPLIQDIQMLHEQLKQDIPAWQWFSDRYEQGVQQIQERQEFLSDLKDRNLFQQAEFFMRESIEKPAQRFVFSNFPAWLSGSVQSGITLSQDYQKGDLILPGVTALPSVSNEILAKLPAGAAAQDEALEFLGEAKETARRYQHFFSALAQGSGMERDPNIFRGPFMENPSWTRAVAGVVETAPLMALGILASVTSGSPIIGGSLIAFPEASDRYNEIREAGKLTPQAANALFLVDFVTNSLLESISIGLVTGGVRPLGAVGKSFYKRMLRSGVPAGVSRAVISASKRLFLMGETAVQEGPVEEGLQSLWGQSVRTIGLQKTVDLTEGLVESIVVGALSGFLFGGMAPGRTQTLSQDFAEAKEKGIDVDKFTQEVGKKVTEDLGQAVKSTYQTMDATGGRVTGDQTLDTIESLRRNLAKFDTNMLEDLADRLYEMGAAQEALDLVEAELDRRIGVGAEELGEHDEIMPSVSLDEVLADMYQNVMIDKTGGMSESDLVNNIKENLLEPQLNTGFTEKEVRKLSDQQAIELARQAHERRTKRRQKQPIKAKNQVQKPRRSLPVKPAKGKGNKPAAVQEPITDQDREDLAAVEQLSMNWERSGQTFRNEDDRFVRMSSGFPQELANIGLNKRHLNAVFDNVLRKNKPLTEKQQNTKNMLLEWYRSVVERRGENDTEGLSESEAAEAVREGNQDEPIDQEANETLDGWDEENDRSDWWEEPDEWDASTEQERRDVEDSVIDRTLKEALGLPSEAKPKPGKTPLGSDASLYAVPNEDGEITYNEQNVNVDLGKSKAADFKLSEKIREFIKKYAARYGEGFVPRGISGLFQRVTQNIFLKSKNQLGTALHEVIHYMDQKYKVAEKIMRKVPSKDGKKMIYDPKTLKYRRELTDAYVRLYANGKRNHKLSKRVKEGMAVFFEYSVFFPKDMAESFPALTHAFFNKKGEFYNQSLKDAFNEAQQIRAEFRQLSPLDQIGARVLSDSFSPEKKFLNPAERAYQEHIDNRMFLEKLEGKLNLADRTVSPVARMWDRLNRIIQHNLNNQALFGIGSFGFYPDTYVTFDKDGVPYHLYEENWHSLISRLDDRYAFDHWLVARRTKMSYDYVDELKAQIEAITAALKESAVVNEETGEIEYDKDLLKQAKQLVQDYKRESAILEADGFPRALAESSYLQGKGQFQDAVELYDRLVAADWELLNDHGFLTPAQYRAGKERRGYTPFKRQLYNEIIGEPIFDTISQKAGKKKISSLFRRRGGKQDIVGPVYTSMRAHMEIMQKTYKQLIQNKILENIAPLSPEYFAPDPRGLIRSINEKTGVITYPQEKQAGILMHRRNGVRTPFVVNSEVVSLLEQMFEPRMYSKNLSGTIEKGMDLVLRQFVRGTTGYYIQFAATNLFIDAMSVLLNTQTNMRPLVDSLKHLKKALINLDSDEAYHFQEFITMGGDQQTFMALAELTPDKAYKQIMQEKNAVTKATEMAVGGFFTLLSMPVQTSEIMTRFAEYTRARQQGVDPLQAFEMAGRVSVPFHHHGSRRNGLNSVIRKIPYFKTGLEVLAQTGRALTEEKTAKQAAFVISILNASSALALLATLGGGSEKQKDAMVNLHPEELGRYIYLPHPNGVDLMKLRVAEQVMMPATLFNMAVMDLTAEAGYKKSEYVRGVTSILPDQLNPTDLSRLMVSWIPHIFSPAAQAGLNKRFYPTVKTREPDWLRRKPLEERTFSTTTDLAKRIGPALGLSPIQMDVLLEGYVGRAVKYVTGKEIRNPFVKKVYFTAGRQILNFKDAVQQNKSNLNQLNKNPEKFSSDEASKIRHNKAKMDRIQGLLSEYYRLMKDLNYEANQDAYDLQTLILDEIDTLE